MSTLELKAHNDIAASTVSWSPDSAAVHSVAWRPVPSGPVGTPPPPAAPPPRSARTPPPSTPSHGARTAPASSPAPSTAASLSGTLRPQRPWRRSAQPAAPASSQPPGAPAAASRPRTPTARSESGAQARLDTSPAPWPCTWRRRGGLAHGDGEVALHMATTPGVRQPPCGARRRPAPPGCARGAGRLGPRPEAGQRRPRHVPLHPGSCLKLKIM
jgi:hypothetical protein